MTVAAPPRRYRLPAAFEHRDFRLLWFATVMSNLVLPMQFITLTFWAVDTYPDQKVLFSGLIVAVRGVGMLVFSLFGGALADRFERRNVLRCTEVGAFATTALLAVVMLADPFGDATIVAVLVLVFCSAANMAVDTPARSASIPAIVGPAATGSAIAVYSVALQLTFPVVLPLVGFLTGTIGPAKTIAASLAAWAVIFPLVFLLRYSSKVEGAVAQKRNLLGDIADGLRYTRRDATILAVIAMVVALQVIGMPGVGMLGPIWMTEILDLSRTEFGFIAMLWGIGAFVASLVFASMTHVTRRGTTLIALVLAFAIAAIVFGHSRSVPLTALANFALGFAMAGTLVTGMTIVQYTVSDAMRGRVLALFPLVMGISMLNVGPVSGAAQGLGLEVVVPAMGWATLAFALVVAVASPALRRAGRETPPPSGAPPAAEAVPVPADSPEARTA